MLHPLQSPTVPSTVKRRTGDRFDLLQSLAGRDRPPEPLLQGLQPPALPLCIGEAARGPGYGATQASLMDTQSCFVPAKPHRATRTCENGLLGRHN